MEGDSRKRHHKDEIDADADAEAMETPELDDILSDLCSKLGAVNTDDHDTLVARLVEVLGVDPTAATFYLEASDWNPHAAVQFHLQVLVYGAQLHLKRR